MTRPTRSVADFPPIRTDLSRMKIIAAEELGHARAGRFVKVAGLVLIRQRPGTASGIVFVTLEDETGIANLIIRPPVFERYRRATCHSMLVEAAGHVERQGQVVHVMVSRMRDLSDLIAGCENKSRDFR
jgi:error-prone DNA polymerase